MTNYRWPTPKASERETARKTYRIPERGHCPQGHPYDVNYTNFAGEVRRYCAKCDTRPRHGSGHGLEAGYERRACWGCGRQIMVILYHPQEAPVICSFDCYERAQNAGGLS